LIDQTHQIGIDLDRRDRARTLARASDGECALVGKAVEYPSPFRNSSHNSVVLQLIEVKAGLLAGQKINMEPHLGGIDLDSRRVLARDNAGQKTQPFGPSDRSIIPFNDRGRLEELIECLKNQGFALVHPQGERLQN
jgi:hypothetical protein